MQYTIIRPFKKYRM